MTPLCGWAHSSSPVADTGLWVSNGGQPPAELPRTEGLETKLLMPPASHQAAGRFWEKHGGW